MTAPATDALKGYRGLARRKLGEWGVKVWSDVRLVNDRGSVFEGVILPRSGNYDDLHVVIKLKNGYNVGLHVDRVKSVEEVGYKEAIYKIPEKEFPSRPDLPSVTLLGTGGTIASRLDYRTGAVIPAFTPGELYGAVPELADICNLTTKKIFGIFSENMAMEQYITLAKAIGEEIANGADGIVIGHGTDTMGHTAAILSFMVQDTPVPIVMVGSQRSSDRPSSDAALNLIHAVRAAGSGDIAEVVICMFGPTSDQYALLHRGTLVLISHFRNIAKRLEIPGNLYGQARRLLVEVLPPSHRHNVHGGDFHKRFLILQRVHQVALAGSARAAFGDDAGHFAVPAPCLTDYVGDAFFSEAGEFGGEIDVCGYRAVGPGDASRVHVDQHAEPSVR